MVKNIIRIIAKLAFCFLILITLEAVLTMGFAFQFEKYSAIGWIVQTLLCILTAYVGLIDFETGKL